MVKFSKNALPEILSVNAYGSSAHEDSPHFADQMEMFEKEEFKTMTFDKKEILSKAERVYHPGDSEAEK
jgi:acyl-homoserine lactone acylase PvdQ